MSQQKQQPVQVHLIGQYATLVGHSFMFPAGCKVFIQKRVDDSKNQKSVYQGNYCSALNTVVEVQFDAKTLRHSDYKDHPVRGAYQVRLKASDLDLTSIPEIPF